MNLGHLKLIIKKAQLEDGCGRSKVGSRGGAIFPGVKEMCEMTMTSEHHITWWWHVLCGNYVLAARLDLPELPN